MTTDSRLLRDPKSAAPRRGGATRKSPKPSSTDELMAIANSILRKELCQPHDFRSERKSSRIDDYRIDAHAETVTAQSPTKCEAVSLRDSWLESKGLVRCRRVYRRRPTHSKLSVNVASKRPPLAARNPVVAEVFNGRVDNVENGTAFLTLFAKDGEILIAQWPEPELARKGIGKSDLFKLTMTDSGKAVAMWFETVPRKPIPDDLWAEIQKIRQAYSELSTDERDGEEEG
jgi:hypothetical protein